MAEKKFEIGDLIENRYRVLTVIGTGGMGTLYRVSDEAHRDGAKDGEIIALKTVRLRGLAAEATESVKRFQREFQLLTQLSHPNLVSVYDYGVTTEGELYFTMEWVEGGDLEPNKRPLEPGAITLVMVQVCRALAYLHARGVIHGDLKPLNVLMADGQVKLVDFGVAHEVRSPEDRARYYTPYYSAPEVTKLEPLDQRADLYSLGAMWYALLVGEPPMFMPGAGKERLIRFALDEALESQDQIPKAIGAVIARLMATSPADRYGSANEVIKAVNEVTGSAYELETRETAASYALRTRFVNREAEIETLQTVWKEAQQDLGKVVLISGESGVGKTRLVTELEVQAELKGARVVWGQCTERGGDAYHSWREVLRVLVRYVEGTDEVTGKTAMKQIGPVLAGLLPQLWERDYMAGLAPPAELEPQAAQLRLNDSIAKVMRAAAELRPTVIVIENAHWADEATLMLLRHLARVPVAVGLLVFVIYRDDEVDSEHMLEKLAGKRVQRVRLGRLSSGVTTELVRSMLGLERLPALLTERVQRTTGGNAFFVQELIRSLAVEEKVLRRTVDGWRVDRDALEGVRLPESIRQVVGRRLSQLSKEGRLVLNWAAVVGMVFWEGGVAEVGQVAWQRVRVALREGLEQGLVVVRDESSFAGEREYLFPNPTVWEVSYESIPGEERQECHARVAAWLMVRCDEEAGGHLGLIADHLERAGQTEQAVLYLRRAGEQAAAQFANAEGAGYFSRALDLLPEDDLAERYDLLLAREKVYNLQGAREAQREDLAALRELAVTLDDPATTDAPSASGQAGRRIELALRQASYGVEIGDYPSAIAAARSVVHLAQATQDMSSEAAGYLQWARALWRQGRYEACRLRLDQALTLSQERGVRQVEADSLRFLGLVFRVQGPFAEAKAHFEQALPINCELGDRLGEGRLFNNLAGVSSEQGRPAEARIYCEKALSIVREVGYRRGESIILGNFGLASLLLGDYGEAKAYHEQALRISREADALFEEGRLLAHLSLVLHLLGDDKAACECARQALSIVKSADMRETQGRALTFLGHALVGLGELSEAVDAYQQALDIRRELGQPHLAMETLAGLAQVSLVQSDLIQAQIYGEEILDYLESYPSTESGHALDGTVEPFRVYLTCYRVLRANQDSRAETILKEAHALLQERAAKIDDEEMRRSFLENVVAHREIVATWESQRINESTDGK